MSDHSRPLPGWTCLTPAAPWQPRDSAGELALRGALWLLGGWYDSWSEPPRDVWRSRDGRRWRRVAADAPWRHSDLPTSLAFRGRLWMMGGWHLGRLPGASAGGEVWSSADGAEWRLETAAPGWSPRLGAGGAVFRNRLWLLGGTRRYYDGTPADLLADVWCSPDGREWRQVTELAPWAPRAYHGVTVHNGRLWVLGGGNYLPEYVARNDVWSSADGVRWRCETEAAPWPPRIWFSVARYRRRLWVLGGWSRGANPGSSHGNWNDVWHSGDGVRWERLHCEPVWCPRHEHSTWVFRDRLWVAGGMAPPLLNDVWALHLAREWPAAAPDTEPGGRRR